MRGTQCHDHAQPNGLLSGWLDVINATDIFAPSAESRPCEKSS
jgi:hypothetical protein